jgi:hypothetical protein
MELKNIVNLFIAITGIGIPVILGFRWIKWIKESKNAFRFLQRYLVTLQIILSTLFLTASPHYFTKTIAVYDLAFQSPLKYWYYYLYMFLSIIHIFLYLSKIGRSNLGAKLSGILMILNLLLSEFGVEGMLFRLDWDYTSDYLGSLLFLFRLTMAYGILLPQSAWIIIFGKLPWTLYLTDEGIKTNIYNEETFSGWLTKIIVESLKDIEFDPTSSAIKKDE